MEGAIKGVVVVLCILALFVSASARDRVQKGVAHARQSIEEQYALRESADPDYFGSAAVDTYTIVYYDFEPASWQGWTRADLTAQVDTFWHVEDYLEPELSTLPGPLEGMKSAWCGAPPGPFEYVCHWISAPGYGNSWDQSLVTDPIYFTGHLDIAYHVYVDCELDYDYLHVEYDAGGGDWEDVASYTGEINTAAVHRVPSHGIKTKLRFHFTSDAVTSDEDGDGFFDSNGAAHVDSITVADAIGGIDFEDFESAPDRARKCGIWHGDVGPAFGMYSGLTGGLGNRDKDPCNDNFTTQVVFFIGSPYESIRYPGLYDTPYCKGAGGVEPPCQSEMVISPVIDLTKYSAGKNNIQDTPIPPEDLPLMGGTWLSFTVYHDVPSGAVMYTWYMREIDASGCPGLWKTRDFVFPEFGTYGYYFSTVDLSRKIGSADSIQVALGVADLCNAWLYPCEDHTPTPWFDNVRVRRFKTAAPHWYYASQNLFQDNFPAAEFDIESYVRADAAEDINPGYRPVIRPGDSVVVSCASPMGGGLAEDPLGGPAVYMHVKCSYIGESPAKPPLAGPSLQGTYGIYRSDDGTWTIIQGDTARAQGDVEENYFMFDLNDSLFTRGYEIDYYFTARNNAGYESALPRWARSYGPYFEFTCLPTKHSDILYVDDFHGRGSFAGAAEEYWTSALKQIFPMDPVDRYDVNAPTAGEGNGLGARAKLRQLIDNYYTIIWDSGDLSSYTISDGTYDKSNDCQMLIDWMDQSEHRVGLWVCGDDIASDLKNLNSIPSLTLLHQWCGVDFLRYSYYDETGGDLGGGVLNPLLTGDADAGVFTHGGVPDTTYIYGGCPLLNNFDVLDKTNQGKYALDYPDFGGNQYYAGIANTSLNSGGYEVRTMWFGFSFQYIRDDVPIGTIDRVHLAADVFAWMQYPTNPTHAEIPRAFKLAQNFPNPFNPVTSIRFDMKEKGLVTLKIYNVAGQLVRTLFDGMKDAGFYSITWDGKNNRGSRVGSGIYFYKMETKGFSATKKTVVLK
jgi:hypothetical protein